MLKSILVLHLTFFLAYGSVCPVGDLQMSSFPTLTGNDFSHSSKYFDTVYQIKKDSNTGNYNIVGHRLVEVETSTNAYFDVKEFTIASSDQEKIIFVSDLGNCVIIQTPTSVKAYQTSTNSFSVAQEVTGGTATTAEANEDCSILRIKFANGNEKVYQNSVQNSILIFGSQSKFDSFYIYGIDKSKQLKKVSKSGINSISLGESALEDTPVAIENTKKLNALILLTKDSQTQKFTLTIVDTVQDKLTYSKSWASTAYTGEFLTEFSDAGDYVLLRDTNGFLLLVKLSYDSSLLSVKEIQLEKTEYVGIFAKDAVISFTDDAVISYQNKKISYFQSLGQTLYYLTSLNADLETEAFKFSGLNVNTSPLITTYIEPGNYDNCYTSASGIEDSEVQDIISNDDVAVVKRENGTVAKCRSDCLSCKENGACLVCALGYELSLAGECVYCRGCRSCFPEFPETCISCFLPEVFNPTTSKCEPPKCTEPFCVSCHLNGTCKECFQGYSAINGQCVKCQDGCPSCLLNGQGTCDSTINTCKLGYIFVNHKSRGVDYSCVQCATGCVSCSKTDISNCTACNTGFYGVLNTETNVYRCSNCMENCQTCTKDTTCDKCDVGYIVNSAGNKCIEKCDSSCLTCNQADQTQCLSCYEGSQLQNSQCVADLSCNPTKTCKFCADGYALSSGQCIKCTYTDSNCQGCLVANLNVCSKCKSGTYLDTSNQCINCQTSCAICQGPEACQRCKQGFYLAKTDDSLTGKCLQCETQCVSCSKFAYLCTSCQTGYKLEGSKCISQNHIKYDLTANSPLEETVLLSRTFVRVLIDYSLQKSANAAKPPSIETKDVTISKLKKGSTILSGQISTFSLEASNQIAAKMSDELAGAALENGYIIIGASAVVESPDLTVGSQSSSGSNIGTILGITIPLGIIVIIGIVLFAVAMRRRKEEMEEKSVTDYYSVNQSGKSLASVEEKI